MTGAQRLSASDIGTVRVPNFPGRDRPVLNAFRHRISEQTAGGGGKTALVAGAQRLSASDIGTGRYGRTGRRHRRVLNAFRHRISEQIEDEPMYRMYACAQRLSASDIGTATTILIVNGEPESAQRLSASDIGTEAYKPEFLRFTLCSTPFGIGYRNRIRSSKMPALFKGAQRLSASDIGTALPHKDSRKQSAVLNAFRHRISEQIPAGSRS